MRLNDKVATVTGGGSALVPASCAPGATQPAWIRREAPDAQPNTAAIAAAVRSTLPLFNPATHMRPERTR